MSTTFVFITGANSGIGKDVTLYLAKKGIRVFAGVRKDELGEQLELLNSNITYIKVDIVDDDQIENAYSIIKQKLVFEDKLIIINNAGITKISPVEAVSREEWQKIFDVNLFGHMSVIKKFLPLLRKFSGRVINIGSTSGFVAWPFAGVYAATKFAFEGVNDSLRLELRPYNIPVIMINPGAIKTPIWNKLNEECKIPLPALIRPYYSGRLAVTVKMIQDGVFKNGIDVSIVSSIIYKAIQSKKPKSRYLVGRSAQIQYTLKNYFPEKFYDWIKFYFVEKKYNKVRDWSGEKYLLAEELGENIDMLFCRFYIKTNKKDYFFRSHFLGDGMSSLKKIFFEEDGLTLVNIPQAKAIPQPNFISRFLLMYQHLKRIRGLSYDWKFYQNRKSHSLGFSFIFFDLTESSLILAFCKKRKITPTSLFLWAMDKASNKVLINNSNERAWVLPVNIRDESNQSKENVNLTSSLTIRIKNSDSIGQLHQQIQSLYKSGIQYGAWILSNISKYLSRELTKNLIKNAKLSWVGVFSNVGNFNAKSFNEKISQETRWIAGPPATSLLPVTTALMSWDNQIGLSLQVHPSVSNDFNNSIEILKEVSKYISQELDEQMITGKIHSTSWEAIMETSKYF